MCTLHTLCAVLYPLHCINRNVCTNCCCFFFLYSSHKAKLPILLDSANCYGAKMPFTFWFAGIIVFVGSFVVVVVGFVRFIVSFTISMAMLLRTRATLQMYWNQYTLFSGTRIQYTSVSLHTILSEYVEYSRPNSRYG